MTQSRQYISIYIELVIIYLHNVQSSSPRNNMTDPRWTPRAYHSIFFLLLLSLMLIPSPLLGSGPELKPGNRAEVTTLFGNSSVEGCTDSIQDSTVGLWSSTNAISYPSLKRNEPICHGIPYNCIPSRSNPPGRSSCFKYYRCRG